MPRDLPWDVLVTTCERLSATYDADVRAGERFHLTGWITAGISAPAYAIDEPVMRRRPFTRRWEELQPIQQAASRAAAVLREGTWL
jgi:hypothetical protein